MYGFQTWQGSWISIIPNILYYDFLDRHLRGLIVSRYVVTGP